jgi:hypothetical protein
MDHNSKLKIGKENTMLTQREAIIEAFKSHGGVKTAEEIRDLVIKKHGEQWKDFSTPMADMVPPSLGGNSSSTVPEYFRVLKRVSRGKYCLIDEAK